MAITVNNFPMLIERLQRNGEAAPKESAERIVDDMVTAMALPKSGRIYGSHQASAPGDAPAIDTRALVDSLHAEEESRGHWVASSDDPKAPMLEYGTQRIEPRPFATPAADAEWPAFQKRMLGVLDT